MANILNGLIPQILMSLDTVSREQVGYIPAVYRNSSAARAALNQTVTYPITLASGAVDVTPGVTPPDAGDQTIGSGTMMITKSKGVWVRWSGEQQRGAMNAGFYADTLNDQFTQAFRTLSGLIETDLGALPLLGSRGWGTIGTVPFGTAGDLTDMANVRKILTDNGAPTSDLHLVIGTGPASKLRGKQSLLLKVNEAGTDATLRRGALNELPIEGFMLHESAKIVKQAANAAASGYVTNGAVAAGVASIVVKTGTGAINAGDLIQFTGDTDDLGNTNTYLVQTGCTGAGTITISDPGVMNAIADGTVMTVVNGATKPFFADAAFSKMALHLVTRAPAMPIDPNGQPLDAAEDVQMVTDPFTGLAFQIAVYKQFQQIAFLVSIAWGVKNVKPRHVSVLYH